MAGPGGVLPEKGSPHGELLARLDALAAGDADWRGNRVFSLVYRHSEAHDAFLKEAHARFSSANGLNPMAFRSLKRLEAGMFGDCEPVGDGVLELREHLGAGYRVYFGRHGKAVVILLCGGSKKTQPPDIKTARQYWADWKRRQA